VRVLRVREVQRQIAMRHDETVLSTRSLCQRCSMHDEEQIHGGSDEGTAAI
jgi:hypothetical protein